MKKKMPEFKNDQDAENFLDQDLSEYIDPKNFKQVNFEFLPKTKKVNIRFSEALLNVVREKAEQEGISYQKFIRKAVEKFVSVN